MEIVVEIVVQIHNFTHKQQQVAVVLLVNQVVLEPAMVAQALLVKGFLVELVVAAPVAVALLLPELLYPAIMERQVEVGQQRLLAVQMLHTLAVAEVMVIGQAPLLVVLAELVEAVQAVQGKVQTAVPVEQTLGVAEVVLMATAGTTLVAQAVLVLFI